MTNGISRRDFVTNAAIAGIASTLALDVARSSANEAPGGGSERRKSFDPAGGSRAEISRQRMHPPSPIKHGRR